MILHWSKARAIKMHGFRTIVATFLELVVTKMKALNSNTCIRIILLKMQQRDLHIFPSLLMACNYQNVLFHQENYPSIDKSYRVHYDTLISLIIVKGNVIYTSIINYILLYVQSMCIHLFLQDPPYSMTNQIQILQAA